MNRLSRILLLSLLAVSGLLTTSCSSTRQSRSFSADELATPRHSLPHEEYPFDDGGNYVDAWAKEGSSRYRATTDTDTEDRPVRQTVRTTKGDASKPKPAKVTPPPTKKPTPPKKTTPTAKPSKSTKPVAKPAPPKPKSMSITVKSGDTLFSLAKRYNTTVPAIKSANGLSSDVLKDGRKLTIPIK
jgi:LysM repeat protein